MSADMNATLQFAENSAPLVQLSLSRLRPQELVWLTRGTNSRAKDALIMQIHSQRAAAHVIYSG